MWNSYEDMVRTLAKKDLEISHYKADLVHAAMGIVGEAGEVFELHKSYENQTMYQEKYDAIKFDMCRELGDLIFYTQFFYDVWSANQYQDPLDMIRSEIDSGGNIYRDSDIIVHATKLIEKLKKVIAYSKPLDFNDIHHSLARMCYEVARWLNHYDITLHECLEANMDKLSKRYSTGEYSNEQAIKREDIV